MNTSLLNNRYRVVKTIGRGGFSTTFLATDTHLPSGRQCVIKQLTPVNQDPEYWRWVQERFQREAAILEQLGRNQDQIPQLFAYFSEAGNFYLVQEWIEGLTLNQKYHQTGTFSEDEVKDILVSILPVLDYVHSQRMVHRDIKPENIILRSQDNQPVLIDFGAVKEAMSTVMNPHSHSNVSIAIGTPGYMASEQAVGRPIYASDLYSLGLTAVYLLTGKIPQDLDTDPRTGEFLWRRLVPDLHSNLATVIDRAIRTHPRDRFTNASEMLAALDSNNLDSTEATVVISPSSPPSGNQTNQTVPTVPVTPGSSSTVNSNSATVVVNTPSTTTTSQPSSKGNGCIKILLGILVLGGLTGTALGLGVNSLISQLRNREPNPTPTLEAEVEPSISPTTPNPSPTPLESSPPSEEPKEVEEIPEPIASPSPESTSELPEVNPTPEPTVIAESPKPTPQPTPRENSNIKIPIFTTGTTESQVKAVLGEPASIRNGSLANTKMLSYRDVAFGKVSLNYSFDRNTGQLRQTEVIFAKSISLEVMEQVLNELLEGKTPQEAKQGLQQIYRRQKGRQWIVTENFKGLIERLRSDRIYIEISIL